MRVSSALAQRYASAFLDLAQEQNALDAAARDVGALDAALKASSDLMSFIALPSVGPKKQQETMELLAAKAGFHKLTRNFLGVLIQNRRLAALPVVLAAFEAERARRAGILTAEVTAAQDLTPAEIKSLQDSLSKGLGQEVHIKAKVEPGILGGLIVTVGSRMVDDSVRGKLARLRTAMGGQANENHELTRTNANKQ